MILNKLFLAVNCFRIPLAVLTDQAACEIGNSLEIAGVFITRRMRLRKTAHVTEPSPFAILRWRDCSRAKSKHSNRELWQRQCAESSAITDRGKRVPMSILAAALKKKRNSTIQNIF